MDNFAEIKNVSYSYRQSGREPLVAVNQISLDVPRGGHVAILGRNGSGKSTLARLINALEQPSEGTLIVDDLSAAVEENIWEIRRRCGMVFQNPDNQIIGTTVEEDVAFGPENLGFPPADIRRAVDDALAFVGLEDMAQKAPHLLSGGQKQKLAIAGILAMRPSCLILDEATSMLDPLSRQEFMDLVCRLIRDEGLTVINITHNMEEVQLAGQVAVMSKGQLASIGTPADIFEQVEQIKAEGLDVPAHNEIVHELANRLQVSLFPKEAATWNDALATVRRLMTKASSDAELRKRIIWAADLIRSEQTARTPDKRSESEPIISVENLTYTYDADSPLATAVLHDVGFNVHRGELLGIVGHSGSGKSTLIQHLNGLLRVQKGSVRVLGLNASNNADIRKIRQKVGLLFQYPEHQLFEETVFRDIAFGPRRMSLAEDEVKRRVLKAAEIVGLQTDDLERSPFELSGGQKRRAAIAGVLAMEPEILILDEPAAGLDPAGRDEILGYAGMLRDLGVTVILVSHSMEDISRLADRVLVLRQGCVHALGRPADVFSDASRLAEAGLAVPRPSAFLRDLQDDLEGLDCDCYSPEAAVEALITCFAARLSAEESKSSGGDGDVQ
ncbi:MAG: energy-coupling factor transporter ATPase [Saccharofermentanales bacterium]|jgi:energy-coupling factor transporter ATPase|nr:energy-coupling factor transporter ATPase [Clostridiaceae bacterium]